MDFELTEEQKSLIALVKSFCEREVDHDYLSKMIKNEKPEDRLPRDLLERLEATGLRTLAVPEKYGGGGISDYLTLFVVGEAFGRWGSFLATPIMTGWVWCKLLNELETAEQKDEFFPQFVEDYMMNVGLALTESDAGTDVLLPYEGPENRMKASAHRDGDEYVINGEKSWVSGGAISRLFLVFARTRNDKPFSESLSLFLVPSNTPGVSIERENVLMTPSIRGNAVVLFDNVRIPSRYLIGKANEGFRYLDENLLPAASLHISNIIGLYQVVYELTKEHAKTRIQGGKPIFEHENIKIRIADMHLYLEALRQFCYRVYWEYDQSESVLVNPRGGDLCNAFCKEVHLRLACDVAEIWGGAGALEGSLSANFGSLFFSLWPRGGSRTVHMLKAANYM